MAYKINEIEEKLANMDFYNNLADKDKMLKAFESKLKQDNKNIVMYKSRKNKRFILAAALITTLLLCAFAFADEIGQILQQWQHGSMSATQYKTMTSPDGEDLLGSIRYNYDLSDVGKAAKGQFGYEKADAFEGIDELIEFAFFVPSYLPTDAKLEDITLYKAGDIYTQDIRAFYRIGDIENATTVDISQSYIGRTGTIDISSIDNFEEIQVNNIAAFVRKADNGRIVINWIQDGVGIQVYCMGISYDEVLVIAESMTANK